VLTPHGQFQSACNDGSFSLSDARAMFRPADVEHRDEYDRPTICVAILLDPRDRPRGHPFSYADASLPTLGRRLSAELDVMDDLSPLVIEGLAADVVGQMSSRCTQEHNTPSWLFKVRDRVESEYSSPPTLSEIAAMVERSPSHVATAFRRVFGHSVGEYVRGVRLWRARTLLDDGATSLAAIAQRTGFSDQSHFCRIFKRRFGLTPGAYRTRRCLLGPRACWSVAGRQGFEPR
jgi:AraC family transcriptional regulator